MEQKRDTFTLAALMRWLVETKETYFSKEEVLAKIADAMAAYELDIDEVMKPVLPADPNGDEFARIVKEVQNG